MRKLDHRILSLALPSIVSNITVPLLGLCDVTVMGHVGGARHIGAIAVGSMIFNVMYWLFGFLRMGTSGLTAQAYGARRPDEAASLLQRSLMVAFGIGLLFVVLQLPIRHLSLWLMQASADIRPMVSTYYNICIWGAPAMLGLYVLTGWYIGMQNTRIPMVIAIGQNMINIAISLLLVLGLKMGIEGVALGTVIAQWTGFMSALLWSVKMGGWRRLGSESLFAWGKLSFFVVHLSLFLRTLCLVAVNLFFTSAGSAQGDEILAANTLLMQFFTLFSYVMDGFAYAGEALAGRYYGARNSRMLSATIRHLLLWGTALMLLFTLIYWWGGPTMLGLLTDDSHVVATACRYLPWAVLIPLAGVAAFIYDGIFIGITAGKSMFLSCLVAAVIFFAVYLSLSPTMGNDALWLALLIYLAIRGIVLHLRVKRSTMM